MPSARKITVATGVFSLLSNGARGIRHKCNWANGKMTARCTGDRCWFSAVTCRDHEQVLYARKELLDWLEQQKIKNNLFAVSAPASMVALCSSIRDFKPKMEYFLS